MGKELLKFMRHQLILMLSLIFVLFLTSCGGKKIQMTCGISEVSQVGINHLQPLINAMELYKKDTGKYPIGVDLAPKYIDKIPVIISGGEEYYDKSKFNILKHENLGGSSGINSDDGSYYSIEFLTQDDRFCLLGGRNNICEYTSDRSFWNCHQ
jgi:hypothetical protein